MKVSTRLMLSFGLLIVLFMLSISIAYKGLSDSRDELDKTVNVNMQKYQLGMALYGNIRDMGIAVRNIALLTNYEEMEVENKRLESQQLQFDETLQKLDSLQAKYATERGQAFFNKVTALRAETFSVLSQAASLGLQNKQQETIRYLMQTVRPIQGQLLTALKELTVVQLEESDAAVKNAGSYVSKLMFILGVLGAMTLIISLLAAWLIMRSLMKQLGGEPSQAQAITAAIAAGDLTTTVTLRPGDQTSLLASLSAMQTDLRQLVSDIKNSAGSVAMAAGEIAEGNTELSSRTEEQAAALQETAARMEQMTVTVKNNTTSAQLTAELARDVAKLAHVGEKDVQRMSTTMDEITSSATKVRDITSVIESIAFQTNILALNAAVEAARAGEEGRGFAVVAGEVRTLAQRSATAAKEIKTLIEQAVEQVESGVVVANGTGQSILKVVNMVGELASSMDDISRASAEQMQGITQIGIAVTQMDSVTQSNAALVEESSSASQSLAGQALVLRGTVEMFKV
ncbi:MCP four helix bundle domain-containing protein [Pantoea sp. JGM49]|uniref:methyl-accepting chemotaxis protein n=1 Tax=Pantoea sp. JGM49 TaxID=2799791 RepID=UPI001BA57970|nr:methyl-accepting chemotaxis protein [Pantoea sp. JGM49]MBS0883859.1 MCP four helix bundle domain-containing protein [Pantoea sp. JGM49]